MDFPLPFGGIRFLIPFEDLDALFEFVKQDEHQHHVAIDYAGGHPRLWGSENLIECFTTWQARKTCEDCLKPTRCCMPHQTHATPPNPHVRCILR